MQKSLAVLGVLLAGALAWAYFVVHPLSPGGSANSGQVQVWQVEPADITRVVFREGEDAVEITRGEEKPEPVLWVETRHRPPPRRKKPGMKKDQEPPRAIETNYFKGNARSVKLLGDLADLQATRKLGPLADVNGAEFGFPAKERWLEVQRKNGDPLRMDLGGATLAERSHYALFLGDQNVYLLPRRLMVQLRRARTGLIDASLFPDSVRKAEKIELTMEGRTKAMWHLKELPPGEPAWGRNEGDKSGIREMERFVDGLSKLRVQDYLRETAGQAPAIAAMELTVHWGADAKQQPSWFKVFGGEGKELRVETSHTGHPVLVSAPPVERLLKGAQRILKGS